MRHQVGWFCLFPVVWLMGFAALIGCGGDEKTSDIRVFVETLSFSTGVFEQTFEVANFGTQDALVSLSSDVVDLNPANDLHPIYSTGTETLPPILILLGANEQRTIVATVKKYTKREGSIIIQKPGGKLLSIRVSIE